MNDAVGIAVVTGGGRGVTAAALQACSRSRPDIIVGIARGGYMPARVLADFFDLMNLAAIKVEHYHGPRKSSRAIVR